MNDGRESQVTAPAGGRTPRHRHGDHGQWSHPGRSRQAPPPTHSGKTMHHPAFRVGEIKHGKR